MPITRAATPHVLQTEYHVAKVVASTEETNKIFIIFHASEQGVHCGMDRTMATVALRFYWLGMEGGI